MPRPTNTDLQKAIDELREDFKNMDSALRSEISSIGAVVFELKDEYIGRKAVEDYKAKKATRDKPILKDPKVLQIIFFLALAFLLLVAAVTKFDVSKVL